MLYICDKVVICSSEGIPGNRVVFDINAPTGISANSQEALSMYV